ncbi:hypothetical protein [Sandaracinus amylolyticus]|uniref:hypothetical protein n=1 Tax=Sandaracinus amylolyticus TaxID=927083 RepID=UPI001F1FB2A9|nr:hypothetical protein [Sandaracinus amylolyticus]
MTETLEGLASLCSGAIALVLASAAVASELSGHAVMAPMVPTVIGSFAVIAIALGWSAARVATIR